MSTDFEYDQTFELEPEILSIHSLNRFTAHNSAPRSVMMGTQFAQRPVISGSETKYILTGVEEEFGRFTFSVRMPEDGVIVSKITKFGMLQEAKDANLVPETLYIYQSDETGEFGCFRIPYHSSHDPVFGFKYELKPESQMLSPGVAFAKDTVFADTPANKGDHHYTFTRNLNMAYMSHYNVGLDGFVVNERIKDWYRFRVYEERTITGGGDAFLLNIHGNDEVYKPIPDIGEYIHENGLVACAREVNTMMAPAMTSRRDTQIPDYQFDTPVFSRPGKGRVVDITVVESPTNSRTLPPEMEEQLRKYGNACRQYYREIMQFYNTETRKHKAAGGSGRIKMTKELHNLVHTAKGMVENEHTDQRNKLFYSWKGEPCDTWRVTVVIEYEMEISRGNKLSCLHGGD